MIPPKPIVLACAPLLLSLGLLAPTPSFAAFDDDDPTENQFDRLIEKIREAGQDVADDEDEIDEGDAEEGAEESDRISPADLMRQMREEREKLAAQPVVAQIDLSSAIVEKPSGPSLFGGGSLDLKGVLDRLETAENDEDVKAVLLTFYNGGLMGFAQAQEIRAALDELEEAGKKTFVYADTYDTISYFVASAATDVVLMDGGELFMPGVSVEPMFYRGALDILGIRPDYVQIGEFKGAEEPYTRTEPSPELEGEMEALVDALYGQIVGGISESRGLKANEVKKAIDRAMTPAADALEAGWVDHLADPDGLRPLLADILGSEPRIDSDYGLSDEGGFDPDNPFAILELFKPQRVDATNPSIAIVYAEGTITGGEGGGDLFGGAGIGSEAIRRAMRIVERDDEIKAVVIRIDSPGGSALASEAMYQSVRRVAESKPVIVSIGGMAASGGYYLACAGDTIYADPAGIVGSIGVVGGKLVLSGLYDKVGLTTATFSRGKNADLFSETQPWDDRQEQLVRRWMESTYDQFTKRVMETRGDKIDDIGEVAKGRIFLAEQGLELGMVDHLGGIDDALADAAEQAGLEGEYDIVILPDAAPNPFAGSGLPFGESPLGQFVSALPPGVRAAVLDAIQMSQLLGERPVVLMSPWRVRVK